MAAGRPDLRVIEQSFSNLTNIERGKFGDILNTCKLQGIEIPNLLGQLQRLDGRQNETENTWDEDFWECKWQINTALGDFYTVSGRQLARWGCAAAALDGKLYMFGGRGTDSRTRSSCHVLDLATNHFSTLKTNNIPASREGHSMVAYKHYLVVFGGCEGGEDKTDPFDDVWLLDVQTKNWRCPPVLGKKPEFRDGHAAGVIKSDMIVYGGNGINTLYGDMYMLSLKNFEWKMLEQEGDIPGPRESMGFCTARERLYVFGGNVSEPTRDEDEYTNDLYEIEVRGSTAHIKHLIAESQVPPKRLSHSMTNLNNDFLIVYGGESFGQAMSDIWVYSIDNNIWRELQPKNSITGRSTHAACTYKNSFIVFGGMGNEKLAKSDLVILSFGEGKIDMNNVSGINPKRKYTKLLTVSGKPNTAPSSTVQNNYTSTSPNLMCNSCGHSSSTCLFLERFPELSYPRFHYFSKAQIPSQVIENLANEFHDPYSAILRIAQIIGNEKVNIRSTGYVSMRGKECVKIITEDDSSELHENVEDNASDSKQSSHNSFGGDSEKKVMILEISCTKCLLTPYAVGHFCAGTSTENLLGPMFKLSPIAIIVSKNEEFLTVTLIQKNQDYTPCFFVIFDSSNQPIFPVKELVQPNFSNVLKRSHLNPGMLYSHGLGTTIYLYPEELSSNGDSILYKNVPLQDFLSYAFYKSPFPFGFIVNNQPVEEKNLKEAETVELLKTSEYRITKKSDITKFGLLIYRSSRLAYWELHEHVGRRHRETHAIVVKLLDDSIISPITYMLKWGKAAINLFADLSQNSLKKPKHSED